MSTEVETNGGANMVRLVTQSGVTAEYVHVTAYPGIEAGVSVQAGQGLGFIDLSGHTEAAHLHFQTSFKGKYFDPRAYLGLSLSDESVWDKWGSEYVDAYLERTNKAWRYQPSDSGIFFCPSD